ncbi:hypothetical protein V8G54_026609 [Vigna mungo]|uniref:DUF8039 domain-containing protein n=1 Tax=Vigna mungo TaxID=3915 RepID=A0AAQ3MZ24_VIGMU
MSTDAKTPLYVGSTKFTRLSAVLRLMNLKASNGWTDKSFTELLTLLNEMLPDGNTLPTRNYDAKKILCPMGMEYKRIHVCPNDCILYRKEFEFLTKCPKCGLSRYKSKNNSEDNGQIEKNGSAWKVVWYLPIVPRLKQTVLVARVRVFKAATIVHGMELSEDEVKVSVDDIIIPDASVPLPTDEIFTVAHAFQCFIAWPKHLVGSVSDPPTQAHEKIPLSEDDPLSSLQLLADIVENKSLEVEYDANVFGRGSEVPIYLHSQDVKELASGTKELNITIIQLWMMYMFGINNNLGYSNDYGFIDLQSIHETNDFEQINTHLTRRFASEVDSSSLASKRHLKILGTHMEFLEIQSSLPLLWVASRGLQTEFKKKKAMVVLEHRRKWWWLRRDGDVRPTSLSVFLEVEWQCDNNTFYGAAAEIEGMVMDSPRNHRALFFDRRVLPPFANFSKEW